MSAEALDYYRSSRLEELTNGPFAETFSYGIGKTLSGFFDFSPDQENEDAGHVNQKQRKPRIITATIPDDLSEGDSITRDYTSEVFEIHYFGEDDEGVPHIWLFLQPT